MLPSPALAEEGNMPARAYWLRMLAMRPEAAAISR
jgi:hypothetical protein